MKNKERNYSISSEEVYGRLKLTGLNYLENHRRFVEAACECGVTKYYRLSSLRSGETNSCGCLRKEVTAEMATTHGLTKHPLYDVFDALKKRCYSPNDKGYKYYGARGITVCDEWRNSFKAFYDWAISHGWEQGLDIDREDNDGNYTPDNCRFVTRPVGNRNTRRNRYYSAFGEEKVLFDWAKDPRCVVNEWTLRGRLDQGTFTEDEFELALTSPLLDRKEASRNSVRNKNFTAFGETKCQSAWLEDLRCLVKIDSLRDRIKKGWTAEEAMSVPPSRDSKNK